MSDGAMKVKINNPKNTKCSGEIEEDNEAKLKNPKVGDEISFGTNKGKNLRWKVLKIQDGKAFIITTDIVRKKTLYHKPGGKITWSNCTLRKWLNNEFINGYFSQEERSRILPCALNNDDNPKYGTQGGAPTNDKVFLLSIDEAETLFADQQARTQNDGDGWWLRSPGKDSSYAAYVSNNGWISVTGNGVNGEVGVRPALWINLKSDLDTEEVTITYDGVKIQVIVQVKGDDRVLAGISLPSCPILKQSAVRTWNIVEEKLIPDMIKNINNGEVQFGDAESYLHETKRIWSLLSKHEIALITQESAAHINELRNKNGYTKKYGEPTAKLLTEIEKHITEDGFSFEDAFGQALSFWNSFASMDHSLFTSVLESLPRKKDGSIIIGRKALLPISTAHFFVDISHGTTFSEILKINTTDNGIRIGTEYGYAVKTK